jgi:adenylate cyclase
MPGRPVVLLPIGTDWALGMTTRRLAAIMAADIAGYSRLMHADEEATHARSTGLMTRMIEPAIAGHGGRMVKHTGDGSLAEFGSAVEAVKCALQFQSEIAANAEDEPIRFRVGVHLGDVIVEPTDIFGDGVNIAARLESLADPGGILVSGIVHETVRGRLSCGFEDLGEQPLKNIARPVRVYRIAPEAAPTRPTPALPDRPSVAVLPFQNMSGDPEQEYFADGMVDEIITALSRVRWFFVISRNSSFTYKGRAVDIKQVGRELGVRYVLEGSVRRAAGRVRITGQLIDASTGHHVWADRFEGDLADVFELQDRVTERVTGAIEPSLLSAEINRTQSKPTESLDAYDLYLRSFSPLYLGTRAGNDSGIALLRRAIEIDSSFTPAKGMLLQFHTNRVVQGWAEPSETEAAIALARQCVIEGRDDPSILGRAGLLLALVADEQEQGIALLERAIRMNPNSAAILVQAGFVYCFAGQPERAIECLSRALRLHPLDPYPSRVLGGIGLAHLLADRIQEALDYTERAVNSGPHFPPMLIIRIAALARAGRIEEARAVAQRYLVLDPSFRISAMPVRFGYGAMSEAFKNALRDAGLPE